MRPCLQASITCADRVQNDSLHKFSFLVTSHIIPHVQRLYVSLAENLHCHKLHKSMLHREQHPDRGHTASHDVLDALMESLVLPGSLTCLVISMQLKQRSAGRLNRHTQNTHDSCSVQCATCSRKLTIHLSVHAPLFL